ncbi:hypothetical protein V6N11_059460 [Hibiscus sabdariffa]|uniref:Reverse transcriptase zinc-binding domain-containing protein n=1 Tax=Hibiscus sabdariffa TaxID=183260 RepID=A0ABR1ZUA2_9ROSI
MKGGRRHVTIDRGCPVYGVGNENIDHILRWCPLAFSLWNSLHNAGTDAQAVLIRERVRWSKLALGWCKLNTDGVVHKHSQLVSCDGPFDCIVDGYSLFGGGNGLFGSLSPLAEFRHFIWLLYVDAAYC